MYSSRISRTSAITSSSAKRTISRAKATVAARSSLLGEHQLVDDQLQLVDRVVDAGEQFARLGQAAAHVLAVQLLEQASLLRKWWRIVPLLMSSASATSRTLTSS